METTKQQTVRQVCRNIPAIIAALVREAAEGCGVRRVTLVRNREYHPATSPLLHYIGRADARIYPGGSHSYLCLTDGALDFFPIATEEGKDQIADNECWIVESGRVEGTEDEHYLTVDQSFDISSGLPEVSPNG